MVHIKDTSKLFVILISCLSLFSCKSVKLEAGRSYVNWMVDVPICEINDTSILNRIDLCIHKYKQYCKGQLKYVLITSNTIGYSISCFEYFSKFDVFDNLRSETVKNWMGVFEYKGCLVFVRDEAIPSITLTTDTTAVEFWGTEDFSFDGTFYLEFDKKWNYMATYDLNSKHFLKPLERSGHNNK